MAANEQVRIEIGFQGGEVLSARVPSADADSLEAKLRARADAVCELNADDGRFLVVLSRVLYVKRYAREAKVGFTPAQVPVEVGIVGLPKAGKTTLFNALTRAGAHLHEAKLHVGMAPIPDERLLQVAAVESSAKVTPAQIRVQDVPGTGAALLGNLRQVDALLAVIDAFSPGADPARDLETVKLELVVADRDHVEKRLQRVRSQAKSGDPALRREVAELEALLAHIDAGGDIAGYTGVVPPELEPLTTKPLIIVANGPGGIDVAFEAELAELDPREAAELREGPSALDEVLRRLTEALDLISFFTAGEREARASTLRRGQTALDAAAQIHTDIARGFIRCEVIRWSDLVECGSRAEAARRGLQRLEGRDYIVCDGDVLHIRFAL